MFLIQQSTSAIILTVKCFWYVIPFLSSRRLALQLLLYNHIISAAGTVISLVDITEFFGVTKRRVYDLMSVLGALEIVTKISKDMIKWNCITGLPLFLARLQQDAFCIYGD